MDWILAVAALIVVVILVTLGAAAAHSQKHGASVIVFRWLLGRPSHGRTVRVDPRDPASHWKLMTNGQRARRTWLGISIFVAWCTAMITSTADAEKATLAALGCLFAAGLIRGGRRAAELPHRRRRIMPMAAGHAAIFGVHPTHLARNVWVMPRVDQAVPGELIGGVRHLPAHWQPSARAREAVETLWQARLPVAEIKFRWLMDLHPPRLELLCASQPPAAVPLAQHYEYMNALPIGEYFLGVGADEEVAEYRPGEQDPMLALAGSTRCGKTNSLLSIVAQGARRGEYFTLIDPNGQSFSCLIGVHRVTVANDVTRMESMGEAIHVFRQDMDDDIETRPHGSYGPVDGYPRTLVIDEANLLFSALGGKRGSQTAQNNPIAQDVSRILYTGARFGYRVIIAGQDLKDAVLFNCRSQFGTLVVFRFKPNQWTYTVGTSPAPDEPTKKGRTYHVIGGRPRLIQTVVADVRGSAANEQAWREYALNGRLPEFTPETPHWSARFDPRTPNARRIRRAALPPAPEQRAIADAPQVLIGVAAAAAFLGMTEVAFKQARSRHPIENEMRSLDGKQPAWHQDTLNFWRFGSAWVPRTAGKPQRKPLRRKTGANK